ncbi:hypothetical protein [Frankia sp. CiP3]|uniref:hypothetical protein n=1 Tax=Frankia sp. CiP3 TaxID=2880971 RepID=UPI001EF3E166|nr:hypothetical protein [Frankia sp. CiP3]
MFARKQTYVAADPPAAPAARRITALRAAIRPAGGGSWDLRGVSDVALQEMADVGMAPRCSTPSCWLPAHNGDLCSAHAREGAA